MHLIISPSYCIQDFRGLFNTEFTYGENHNVTVKFEGEGMQNNGNSSSKINKVLALNRILNMKPLVCLTLLTHTVKLWITLTRIHAKFKPTNHIIA